MPWPVLRVSCPGRGKRRCWVLGCALGTAPGSRSAGWVTLPMLQLAGASTAGVCLWFSPGSALLPPPTILLLPGLGSPRGTAGPTQVPDCHRPPQPLARRLRSRALLWEAG